MFFYTLLFSIGLVLTAPYYLWRMRGRILRWTDWRERLGRLPESFGHSNSAGPGVWIHAVSVGETLAIVPLVKALQERFPEVRVFLSHTTATGRETGEMRLPNVAGRFFLPLDWPWSVRSAMLRIRPGALLVVETELWPNLLRAARESGAKVALVNARISERSFRRYRLAPRFMRRVLGCIDWFGAQTPADADRLLALGAVRERVSVAGNLKFDGWPPVASVFSRGLAAALESTARRPVAIAASTMPQEEEKVLAAWYEVRTRFPQALLIIAPRHPARFDAVAATLANRNFVRRTDLASDEGRLQAQLAGTEVLLLDTIGELAGLFELADVVFVGGSLVPTGGHNLLEPAYWAKPVLFGPHMENFRDAAAIFLQAGAAIRVEDEMDLAKRMLELFGDSRLREEMGRRGKKTLEEGSGATERTLAQIHAWLDPAKTRRLAAVRGGEAK